MTALINAHRIGRIISERFGIEFFATLEEQAGYPLLIIRPADLKSPNGFSIHLHARWRSVGISFVPDSYAQGLLSAMADATSEKKIAFATFSNSMRVTGNRPLIKIGNKEIELAPDHWPEAPWSSFSLSMERMGININDGAQEPSNLLIDLVTPFIGMVVALLPLEHEEIVFVSSESGLPEGAKIRVEVNRYERKLLNREACISIFGTKCRTCGLDLGEKYGDLGHGFIHVHHITPVSEIGADYIIDPAKDLIPVCPNCHAILHRQDPPLSPEDLRAITGFQCN